MCSTHTCTRFENQGAGRWALRAGVGWGAGGWERDLGMIEGPYISRFIFFFSGFNNMSRVYPLTPPPLWLTARTTDRSFLFNYLHRVNKPLLMSLSFLFSLSFHLCHPFKSLISFLLYLFISFFFFCLVLTLSFF